VDGIAFLNKMDKVALIEKVTFKQRLGDERVVCVNSLENAMQAEVATREKEAG